MKKYLSVFRKIPLNEKWDVQNVFEYLQACLNKIEVKKC